MAFPSASKREGSHPAPLATAVGKQVAGSDSLTPSISPVFFWQRTPWGPSLIVTAGMPYCSIALLCQKSAPLHRVIFSFRDIFCKISAIRFSIIHSPLPQRSWPPRLFQIKASRPDCRSGIAAACDSWSSRGQSRYR